MERWAIYIDIEGFSILWETENQVIKSLRELMRAIFRVGRQFYPDSPDRLFTHQLGDGFLIVSDFHEENLERAITIAVALMQHVAACGWLTKSAIAEGELSDIQGCYPGEVMDELEGDNVVSLEMGLMTLFPIMGTALIRAVKCAKKTPSGPLLTIENSKSDRIPSSVPINLIGDSDLLCVDWVHMETDLLSRIQKCANLNAPGSKSLEVMLTDYFTKYPLPEKWVANTWKYLGVKNRANFPK